MIAANQKNFSSIISKEDFNIKANLINFNKDISTVNNIIDFRSGLNMKCDSTGEVTYINISHKNSKHGSIPILQHQNIINKHPLSYDKMIYDNIVEKYKTFSNL